MNHAWGRGDSHELLETTFSGTTLFCTVKMFLVVTHSEVALIFTVLSSPVCPSGSPRVLLREKDLFLPLITVPVCWLSARRPQNRNYKKSSKNKNRLALSVSLDLGKYDCQGGDGGREERKGSGSIRRGCPLIIPKSLGLWPSISLF